MPLLQYHNRIRDDTNYDRRHAVQNVCGEANGIAEAIASKFRKVDSGADSEGYADQASNRQYESRSHNGIGHSAARLAHLLRGLRKKSPLNRSEPPFHHYT